MVVTSQLSIGFIMKIRSDYLLLLILEYLVTIGSEHLFVCPGRRVSLNCTVEPARASIQWIIYCQCSVDRSISCGETCNPMRMVITNTGDSFLNGTTMCTSAMNNSSITYEHNVTTIMSGNNVLVTSSVLTITIPQEYRQQSISALCLDCYRSYRHLLVLGKKGP